MDNKKKKIGILSLYYNSFNYGGMLQAYALTKFLNNNGVDAEQIAFKNVRASKKCIIISKKRPLYRRVLSMVKRITLYLLRSPIVIADEITRFLYKTNKPNFKKRIKLFEQFQGSIPHSEKIYCIDTIKEVEDKYDLFVVGSDQTWNFLWTSDEYFLNFVKDNNKKVAYAASFGDSKYIYSNSSYIQKMLKDFKAISLREFAAVNSLEKVLGRDDIKYVVDPTLLLTRTEWDKIATKRIIRKNYVFCYFLGGDSKGRELAKQYAKKMNLKLVNMSYLYPHTVTKDDIDYGDYRIESASPLDFISLIKYSTVVFTNSFHACVFSTIFNKQFFVFNREDLKNMSERIISLCDAFDCGNHFYDGYNALSVDVLLNVPLINYFKNNQIQNLIGKSINFVNQYIIGNQ